MVTWFLHCHNLPLTNSDISDVISADIGSDDASLQLCIVDSGTTTEQNETSQGHNYYS